MNPNAKYKYKKFPFLLNIILLFLYFSVSINCYSKRYLKNKISEITLTVAGKGTIKYIYSINPDEVYVNNELQKYCNISCLLNKSTNTVLLKFNNQITNCNKMFYELKNITKIDLSKFDFSNVNNMAEMFYGCSKLTSIEFGNINTNSVKNM